MLRVVSVRRRLRLNEGLLLKTSSRSNNVSGTLTPRTDLNAYDAVLSFGSTSGGATPMDGTYDGIAYYDTETGRLYLAGISSATNHGIGFR